MVPTNAFLIPQWGGITVSNQLHTSPSSMNDTQSTGGDNKKQLTVKQLKPVMEIFLAQLRGLMGVKAVQLLDGNSAHILVIFFDFEYMCIHGTNYC